MPRPVTDPRASNKVEVNEGTFVPAAYKPGPNRIDKWSSHYKKEIGKMTHHFLGDEREEILSDTDGEFPALVDELAGALDPESKTAFTEARLSEQEMPHCQISQNDSRNVLQEVQVVDIESTRNRASKRLRSLLHKRQHRILRILQLIPIRDLQNNTTRRHLNMFPKVLRSLHQSPQVLMHSLFLNRPVRPRSARVKRGIEEFTGFAEAFAVGS